MTLPWTWTLESTSPSLGRVYSRPLGTVEYGFYYDTLFLGAADSLQRSICETDPAKGVFSHENVNRAWVTVKQHCPLLGSTLDVRDEETDVRFVVAERMLSENPPGQVTFIRVARAEDVDEHVLELLGGPQRDFARVQARVIIFELEEDANNHHVVLQVAHTICDATCLAVIWRAFLNALVTLPSAVPNLEERLSKVISADDLNPARAYSLARQRWRQAIARVILELRDSGLQVSGPALPRGDFHLQCYVCRLDRCRVDIRYRAKSPGTHTTLVRVEAIS